MATKKTQAKLIGLDWSLETAWQQALYAMPPRLLVRRERIFASEMGGSFRDRYLKMFAHPYSNPINPRALLKMLAGQFFEDVVAEILTGTGLLKARQIGGIIELPGMLPVSGKLDFTVGGVIDWDEAEAAAQRLKQQYAYSETSIGSFKIHMVDYILPHFKNIFSVTPAMEYVSEIKSLSGFVFALVCKNNKPRRGHPLQALHYLLTNKEIPKALLTYISRESCELKELYIERAPQLLKEYKQDVATMTDYYNYGRKDYLKHLPPPDPEIIFEEASFQFRKNNLVEYSNYISFTYGYKNIDHFKEVWDKKISKWNGSFRRNVLEGKPTGKLGKPLKLTDDNKIVIEDMIKSFPDYEKYLKQAKKAGAFVKPETENEED